MTTIDLLEIIKNKTNYTDIAHSVALFELKHRKIGSDIIDEYKPAFTNKINHTTKENCLKDLSLFYKLLYFYIMWFPKARRFYLPIFSSDGYMLKDNQSNYYSICGFCSMVISIIIINTLNTSSLIAFLTTWTCYFFLSYLVDIGYNRQRQIDNIKKILEKDEIPWGFY